MTCFGLVYWMKLCRTGSDPEESSFLYTDFQFYVSQSASYSKMAVKGAVYKTTALQSKCEKWLLFQVVLKHFVIIVFSKSALCVCTFNSGSLSFHLRSCMTVKKLKHLLYEEKHIIFYEVGSFLCVQKYFTDMQDFFRSIWLAIQDSCIKKFYHGVAHLVSMMILIQYVGRLLVLQCLFSELTRVCI
jgi:hypothetical protein